MSMGEVKAQLSALAESVDLTVEMDTKVVELHHHTLLSKELVGQVARIAFVLGSMGAAQQSATFSLTGAKEKAEAGRAQLQEVMGGTVDGTVHPMITRADRDLEQMAINAEAYEVTMGGAKEHLDAALGHLSAFTDAMRDYHASVVAAGEQGGTSSTNAMTAHMALLAYVRDC